MLFILWQTLFKPQIKSAAKDAVAGPLTSIQNQVDELTTTTAAGPHHGRCSDHHGAGVPVANAAARRSRRPPVTARPSPRRHDPSEAPGRPLPAAAPSPRQFGNPADFVLGTPVANGTSQEFSQSFSGEFSLTDLVVQNPHGDVGSVQIKRDDTVLFDFSLNDFRTQDLHNVAPLVFKPSKVFRFNVVCQTATDATSCPVTVSFAGFQK